MDRTPFSAFLLLLVGLVLLAQVVTGNIDAFIADLFGQAPPADASSTSASGAVGAAAKVAVTTRSGNRRTGTVAA